MMVKLQGNVLGVWSPGTEDGGGASLNGRVEHTHRSASVNSDDFMVNSLASSEDVLRSCSSS
jgi:hypothetical protein